MAVADRSRALGVILAVAVASALLVTGSHEFSRERILENQRQQLLATLNAVFPAAEHDNDLSRARFPLQDRELLGSSAPLDAFIAVRDGSLAGAVLTVIAPDGYNGPIRILLGIRSDGSVTGVRVLGHRETPGLGDGIEITRSNWVRQFEGRGLGAPPEPEWAVVADGGRFDALTGATVTPRAVIRAVRNALRFFERHRDTLEAAAGQIAASGEAADHD
jgi:electron transport complex protein RnfG